MWRYKNCMVDEMRLLINVYQGMCMKTQRNTEFGLQITLRNCERESEEKEITTCIKLGPYLTIRPYNSAL